jgi:ribosomal protein L20A (L18A)
MYEMNGVIYAARTNSNWSREERDLKAYLAMEHNYHSIGARSARDFLSRGIGKIDEGAADKSHEREPITERRPRIISAILATLRLREPDRAGD